MQKERAEENVEANEALRENYPGKVHLVEEETLPPTVDSTSPSGTAANWRLRRRCFGDWGCDGWRYLPKFGDGDGLTPQFGKHAQSDK